MTAYLRSIALLLALLLSSIALPLHAQQHPASSDQTPAPQPWSSLNPAQRDVLAPLEGKWNTLSPRKQAHMLKRAKRWVALPPEKREEVRQHIARWQTMTPQERQQARENKRKFHQLSAAQREQLHATFQRFQKLPPDQRERLIRQWHALPPAERLHWDERSGHDTSPAPSMSSPHETGQP